MKLWPIKESLNKKPANIDPTTKQAKEMIIIASDSWTSDWDTFWLLNYPWKVLNINLHEYMAVKNAVKIPTPAAM